MNHFRKYQSPVGEITLCADTYGISGLWFAGQVHFGEFGSVGEGRVMSRTGEEESEDASAAADAACECHLDEAVTWLDSYFAGKRPEKLPNLSLTGSAFRQKVWRALLQIPYGKTLTYRDISLMVQEPGTNVQARAVGGAIGANPISILVPCHRVIGTDGSLTGYSAGLEVKRFLLNLEDADRGRTLFDSI